MIQVMKTWIKPFHVHTYLFNKRWIITSLLFVFFLRHFLFHEFLHCQTYIIMLFTNHSQYNIYNNSLLCSTENKCFSNVSSSQESSLHQLGQWHSSSRLALRITETKFSIERQIECLSYLHWVMSPTHNTYHLREQDPYSRRQRRNVYVQPGRLCTKGKITDGNHHLSAS